MIHKNLVYKYLCPTSLLIYKSRSMQYKEIYIIVLQSGNKQEQVQMIMSQPKVRFEKIEKKRFMCYKAVHECNKHDRMC